MPYMPFAIKEGQPWSLDAAARQELQEESNRYRRGRDVAAGLVVLAAAAVLTTAMQTLPPETAETVGSAAEIGYLTGALFVVLFRIGAKGIAILRSCFAGAYLQTDENYGTL
jgi:hypothetical protein